MRIMLCYYQFMYRKMSDGTIKLKFSNAVTSLVLPPTVHTEGDWLQDLKANFASKIISGCSARTREAVDKNEDVEVLSLNFQSLNRFFTFRMQRCTKTLRMI